MVDSQLNGIAVFQDYPLLRMVGVPDIEVHIVDSTEAPSGVGEPAVPAAEARRVCGYGSAPAITTADASVKYPDWF